MGDTQKPEETKLPAFKQTPLTQYYNGKNITPLKPVSPKKRIKKKRAFSPSYKLTDWLDKDSKKMRTDDEPEQRNKHVNTRIGTRQYVKICNNLYQKKDSSSTSRTARKETNKKASVAKTEVKKDKKGRKLPTPRKIKRDEKKIEQYMKINEAFAKCIGKNQEKAIEGKYGGKMPTFQKIQKDRQRLEDYKKIACQFNDISNESQLDRTFALPESDNEEVLGCEHLTSDDIKRYFKQNIDYCKSIASGEIDNARHAKYMKNLNRKHKRKCNLIVSDSLFAFSSKQKLLLIEYCQKYIPELPGIKDVTEYYFQVVLPELCIKIFQDEHEMRYDEAVEYLRTRSVED